MSQAYKWVLYGVPAAWLLACFAEKPWHPYWVLFFIVYCILLFGWAIYKDLRGKPGERGALWLTVPMEAFLLIGMYATLKNGL